MIRAEDLAYFKDLLEGRAQVSWNAWFRENDAALVKNLPRMDYLRLKFKKLDEAERLLKEAGINYQTSPAILKRERYFASLHEGVLDERGRPTPQFLRKMYGGAGGAASDGDAHGARQILAKELGKILRLPMIERAQELGDFCFEGEQEYALGNQLLGLIILELVSELATGDDLLDPAILRAREVLSQRQ
jgi:hypothetical protein